MQFAVIKILLLYATSVGASDVGYNKQDGAVKSGVVLPANLDGKTTALEACQTACTENTNCRYYTHCPGKNTTCFLKADYVNPGMKAKNLKLKLETSSGCTSYLPKCWVKFHDKDVKTDDPIYKASKTNTPLSGYQGYTVSPNCYIKLGKGKVLKGRQTWNFAGENSFALFHNSVGPDASMNKESLVLMCTLGAIGVGSVLCFVCYFLCPKCVA